MLEPVVIHLGKLGTNSIRIGEVDVTGLVTKCTVTAEAGSMPTVSLDMQGHITVDGADVQMPHALSDIAAIFQAPPALLGERMAWSLANHPSLNRPLSPHALNVGSRT